MLPGSLNCGYSHILSKHQLASGRRAFAVPHCSGGQQENPAQSDKGPVPILRRERRLTVRTLALLILSLSLSSETYPLSATCWISIPGLIVHPTSAVHGLSLTSLALFFCFECRSHEAFGGALCSLDATVSCGSQVGSNPSGGRLGILAACDLNFNKASSQISRGSLCFVIVQLLYGVFVQDESN